jgi:hypothetical protein
MSLPVGVKKTAEGFVFTVGVLKGLGWLAVVAVAAVSYAVRTNDRIRTAVPERAFHDTTAALRRDLKAIAFETKQASDRATSIGCYIARYPAGLCDDVTRASSGSVQRSTP